jgi:hypothetical protein
MTMNRARLGTGLGFDGEDVPLHAVSFLVVIGPSDIVQQSSSRFRLWLSGGGGSCHRPHHVLTA